VHKGFKKAVACICLLSINSLSNAASEVLISAQENVEKIAVETQSIESGIGFDEDEVINYHITRNENPDNPCDRGLDDHTYEKYWYDETQIYINSKFCEPALWFDNFFATDRIFDEGVPGTYVRWRNEFTYDEEEYFSYKMRLKFSVVLPGFKNKLRLSFEGDKDEDLRDISPGSDDTSNNSLNLQLDIKETARSKFNVRFSLSPRIRFRYRYTYPIYDDITLRLTQEVQWKNGVNSARTRFDFEQVLNSKILFRSSTEANVSEKFDGVDWLQAFVLFQRINKKSSLAYEASVNGITEPFSKTTDSRVGIRYRKNFHREWLFFEIAPEVTWPVTVNRENSNIEINRRSKWLLFFRLEVHFGNAYKKRYRDYN